MTMVQPSRRFGSTEHLASEAVAAFVDGELRMNAHLRAAQHLSICPDCAAEVDAQRQARHALRAAADHIPQMPSSLLGTLSNIPVHLYDLPSDGGAASPQLSQPQEWFAARRWSIRRRR